MQSTRYALLDFIRGIALINMICYHLIWDIVHIFGVEINWYTSTIGYIWQQCICHTFIFLSGFCFDLGKRKVKRGITILAVSFVITAVTVIFMPENTILFGVLTLIGSASLFMIPAIRIFDKLNNYVGLTIMLTVFVLTRHISSGTISLGAITVPKSWYANIFTAYLGFPPNDFVSQDYFPIIPWIFLYIAGYYFYRIITKQGWTKPLAFSLCPPVEWCGRKSLIIYVIHQPIIYAILKLFLFH